MERVFYNLVLNAAQATAPGGAVTVKTRAAGGMAEISVIDRGVGIDPRNMKDHLQSVLHHQARGRRPRPRDRFQDRGRTRR